MVHLRTVLAVCLIFIASSAQAVSLLRDPDIEYSLRRLAKPVLQAAGLPANLPILVVDDGRLNAFVVDRNAIYLNSGLILRTSTPAELQFVIAHEAAHIANGHITRRRLNADYSNRLAQLGLALGVAAAASSGNSEAGAGIAMGVASSAQRSLYGHTRAEESSADQTAIRWMSIGGLDTGGAISLMQVFRGQEHLKASRMDPYARSHPLSRDRLRRLEALAKSYGGKGADRPSDSYWYERAKGKLSAFLREPRWTEARAKQSPTKDIERMRLAVVKHRRSDWQGALALMEQVLAERPGDPFYHELKGQILLEARQFKSAEAAYRRASELAPRDALILASLGHAMVVQGGEARLRAALPVLERARALDYRSGRVMRDLGSAYAQLGQPGMAALSVAERHALSGRMKDAHIQAERATGLLSRGSPAWQRAQDVLNASKEDG
ncbi:peptidase M48 [Pseudooceanicola antarcticus]|uniref:Peptidase M48 n=1 Tax=Pseudooceanicola antarcticus TaxID=1247613 RepID=A0ABX4MQ85_9RHOB|nr:peptidase M48 [Pseudooceanicola antarcticus]